MKRILFSFLAVGLIFTFSPTTHAADIVLKVAHNGPEAHPFQNGFEKFKQVMEDRD